MSAKKKTVPAEPTPPAPPSEYEQGMLDTLEFLRQEVSHLSDAHREAITLLWSASPEAQSLLSFANPAVNIAGDVENRVTKRAIRHLNERRLAEKAVSQ